MWFLSLFSLRLVLSLSLFSFFFFNDTATTEIYTLSLHDALPISFLSASSIASCRTACTNRWMERVFPFGSRDRKSTRLNSSHDQISYAVFCLKKKKQNHHRQWAPTPVNPAVSQYIHVNPPPCTYT